MLSRLVALASLKLKNYFIIRKVREIVPRNIVSLLVTLLARDSKTTVNCAATFAYSRRNLAWDSTGAIVDRVCTSSLVPPSLLLTIVTSYTINYRFD